MLVSVFTGFLGAGKTTILQHVRQQLLEAHPKEKVLTIVNDVSENNVDQYAFSLTADCAARGDVLRSSSEAVSTLSGGCVCCNLLGELVKELLRAHAEGYTYVLLECTGVADPVPVVVTLSALPALEEKVSLDAVVTVVHARSLHAVTQCPNGMDTQANDGDEVDQYMCDVAAMDPMRCAQAQGATVLLVNNWESLDIPDAGELVAWKRALCAFTAASNPSARVYFTNNGGRFAFNELVFRQNLFSADGVRPYFLRTYAASGKQVGDLGDPAEEAGELAAIGLRSFTFESAVTIVSVAALRAALATRLGRSLLKDVWRSKGFFTALDDGITASQQRCAHLSQFRWQSVGRQFDFGEVLPPTVPLLSQPGVDGARHALKCQIVFIGCFSTTLPEKASQVQAFFAHVDAQ